MNISAINAYGTNFKSNYANGRLMSLQGSDYVFPADEPKTKKNKNNETTKEKETSKEPEKVETTIHWMNYGDGHFVPVTVEIKK